jgi:hypothetical protein
VVVTDDLRVLPEHVVRRERASVRVVEQCLEALLRERRRVRADDARPQRRPQRVVAAALRKL